MHGDIEYAIYIYCAGRYITILVLYYIQYLKGQQFSNSISSKNIMKLSLKKFHFAKCWVNHSLKVTNSLHLKKKRMIGRVVGSFLLDFANFQVFFRWFWC